jgi:hypothetical protein
MYGFELIVSPTPIKSGQSILITHLFCLALVDLGLLQWTEKKAKAIGQLTVK